jgi:hypothetical protein
MNDENNQTVDVEVVEEEISDDLNPQIFVKNESTDVETLYNRWRNKEIDLNPHFQRKFVWKIDKKSRLIESALLNIPIPPLYFAEKQNATWETIDGKQRLTTFFDFITNKFPLDLKTNLKGKYFKDLPDDLCRRIKRTSMHVVVVLKESDESQKYELFERLNTGSELLSKQELWNCLYHGKYNNLLRKLADNKKFRKYLQVTKGINLDRMEDIRLVLRFASLFHKKYKFPLNQFMLDDMKKNRDGLNEKETKELEKAWKNGIDMCHSIFGDNMFKRYLINKTNKEGIWTNRFHAVSFELLMISLSKYSKHQVMGKRDMIREAWIDTITNKDFLAYCVQRTTYEENYNGRYQLWNNRLVDIINVPRSEPRCFSRKLKEELYRINPYCGICGQYIASIDDAAVDHIKQYWLGGETIDSNARLAHRFCNSSRPRNNVVEVEIVVEDKETPVEILAEDNEILTMESVIEEGVVTSDVLIDFMKESN